MNILLIVISFVLLIGSIHALFRDRNIEYKRISKITKGLFAFFFLTIVTGICLGNFAVFGQEMLFLLSFSFYTLMSGNIKNG